MDIALLPTINLSNATSSLNGDADVEVGKSLSTEEENGLNSLHLHTLGLHDVDGLTVQLHDSVSVLAVSDGNSGLLHREISKSSLKCKYDQLISYLTAEGLHRGLSLFRGHIYSTLYYCKRLGKLEMGHIGTSRQFCMNWIWLSFAVFFVNTLILAMRGKREVENGFVMCEEWMESCLVIADICSIIVWLMLCRVVSSFSFTVLLINHGLVILHFI